MPVVRATDLADLAVPAAKGLGDLADFRVHPRLDDDGLGAALGDGAAGVRHVDSVADADVVFRLEHGVGLLGHREGFAGEQRLVGFEI